MKNYLLIALLSVVIAVPATVSAQDEYAVSKDFFGRTANDLPVYPNPTTGIVRVVLDKYPHCPVYVYVIDMNGTLMREYEYASGTYNIDVDISTLPTGLYSVRLFGKDIDAHNLKVVKQ